MAGTVVKCVIYVSLIFGLYSNVLGTERVPVLIWDSNDGGSREVGNPSPLHKLSSDEFSDYISKKVAARKSKPVIALFLEENLCVEDFSWEDVEEHSSFPLLENLTSQAAKVDFLPSVHAPLIGLKSLGYSWHLYHSNDDPATFEDSDGGMILIIKLGDAEVEENRPEFLRRHDRAIGNIFVKLKSKYDDLIGLYTSRHSSRVEPEEEPSVRRVRSLLAVEDGADANATFWHDKDNLIFLYTPNYPRINAMSSDPSQAIPITGGVISRDARTDFQRLVIVFSAAPTRKITLRLNFTETSSRYWKLEEVEYEENGNMTVLKTSSDIYAPVGFSYHCSSQIVFKNGSITFNLTNVQIQPNVVNNRFGDAYDCVWFFTMPIWSGLFVTAILAIIMIWGLTMILDIKTMDRFDDPKGKTITISATD